MTARLIKPGFDGSPTLSKGHSAFFVSLRTSESS